MNLTTILKYELVRMNTVLLRKEKKCLDARTNLSYRFEDLFYEKCRIKKQKSHNCRNLYKLMNCRVNIKHFFKNLDIFKNILKKNKNSRSMSFFVCEDCILYFSKNKRIILY